MWTVNTKNTYVDDIEDEDSLFAFEQSAFQSSEQPLEPLEPLEPSEPSEPLVEPSEPLVQPEQPQQPQQLSKSFLTTMSLSTAALLSGVLLLLFTVLYLYWTRVGIDIPDSEETNMTIEYAIDETMHTK